MKEPVICGGTTRSYDKDAPKTIISEEMTVFKAESSFTILVCNEAEMEKIHYLSVYAAALEGGSLLVLSARRGYDRSESSWAFVSRDIFPTLVDMVKNEKLAENNGYHSFTHGLPENFGGEVLIKYKSGEKISFSDNQAPILNRDFGNALYELFTEAINSESAAVPDAGKITEIRFDEEREDGYSRAALSKNADGSYTIKRKNKYDGPQIYEKTETVTADVFESVIDTVRDNAVLLWNKLPESDYRFGSEKRLTFVFDDKSEIVTDKNRDVPQQFKDAFFNIEFEIASKNHG